MKRRITKLALVGLVTVALAGFPTGALAAKDEPLAGCGAGFELMKLKDVLKMAAPGFEETIKAHDANADKFLCVRMLENFPEELFDPAFVYTDNNVPL